MVSTTGDRKANLLFVLCSEDAGGTSLIAACEPAIVLQSLGGARFPGEEATRATFDYAIRLQGVRRLVVCGHSGCRAFESSEEPAPSQERTARQTAALMADRFIGELLHEHRVGVTTMWLNGTRDKIYVKDPARGQMRTLSLREALSFLGVDPAER